MKVDVEYRPAFATAKVALDPGEDIVVEAGAMVAMSSDLELQTKARGGFLKSRGRRSAARASSSTRSPLQPAVARSIWLRRCRET